MNLILAGHGAAVNGELVAKVAHRRDLVMQKRVLGTTGLEVMPIGIRLAGRHARSWSR